MSVPDKIREYLDNPYNDESVRAAIDRAVSKSENQPSHRAVRFVADLLIAELDNGVEPADVVAGVDAKTEEISSDVSDAVNSVASAAQAEGSRRPSEIQPSVSDVYDAARDVVSGFDRNSPGYHAATLVLGNVTGSNAEEAARRARNAAHALRNSAFASQRVAQERFGDLSTCVSQCRSSNVNHEETGDCPVSLLDCSVSGVSCSDNTECCSGSCEGGSCVDPVASYCGSEDVPCCNGNSCDGNLVCSSGTCEVPVVCGSESQACCTSGAACVSGFECVSGTCEAPCGAEDQKCCTSGDQCNADLVCAGSGAGSTCQPCGSGGQVCCGNRTCDEDFACTGQGTGTCVGDCGSEGQECCTGDSQCGTNLVCITSGETRTCRSCGGKDLACCTTGNQCSESGLQCVEGICAEAADCGSEGQACCAEDTCTSDLECESGICQATQECGSESEICCTDGDKCDSDLECDSGICREVECGSEGDVCCEDDECDSDLECDAGICVEAEECGSESQDCCYADACVSGLECRVGTCKEIEGCGSEGNVCCRGGRCDSDFECVDNLCEMPEVIVEFVQHFSLGPITSGSNETVIVTERGIPFSSIQFAVSEEISNAELNVTSRPNAPPGISGGPVGMQSYGYVTIASEDLSNEDLSGVYFEFSVDKNFFSGTLPSQIRFFEHNQETQAWNKLDDPVHLSEDNENHYFRVAAEGLVGDFAIALEKFVSCAHKDSAGGRIRYSLELIYSWEESPEVNHKITGQMSTDFSE